MGKRKQRKREQTFRPDIKFGLFFALLFLGSSHIETIYAKCRVCDNCGAKSQSAITADEAISRAKQAGWVHINEGNLDYCPKCKSKLNLDIEE